VKTTVKTDRTSMPDSPATTMPNKYPVAVMVEFQPIHDNRWVDGRWVVAGVVAGEQLAADGIQCRRIHTSETGQQYLWSGFSVELHKDDAESYYHNLMSDHPGAFVICNEETGEPLRPAIVTLSYGEATSYMETDVRVERVAMPAELYRCMERFVLDNYAPEKTKKRKRDNWKEEGRGRRQG
jgi:hypothetical protein